MRKKQRKTTNHKETLTNNNVIRCKTKMIPVLENETCEKFQQKQHTEAERICKNCINSF